jgi:hypothetical protein
MGVFAIYVFANGGSGGGGGCASSCYDYVDGSCVYVGCRGTCHSETCQYCHVSLSEWFIYYNCYCASRCEGIGPCCNGHCCSLGYQCCGGEGACCPGSSTCCGAGYCCSQSQCTTCVGGYCVTCGGDPNKFCCNSDGTCCDADNCERCVNHSCESKCKPEYCESCDGNGHCVTCGGDPKKCCVNGECKQCCKSSTTGNCEAHNSDCGCDPIGLGNCSGKIKEWTLGATHFCYSECDGWPCNYNVTNVPCYATRPCASANINWPSLCISGLYCQTLPTLTYCQVCIPNINEVAEVVEQMDCRCN